MDLDWGVIDKAKTYSPAPKKCMLCLTGNITFLYKNLLNKRNKLVTRRREIKLCLANYKDTLACLKHFSQSG